MDFQNWEQLIDNSTLGTPLVLLEKIDSTNEYLKSRTLPHGAAVIALEQTAGKGRLGREWISKAGESLSMSVLIKSKILMPQLPIICAAAAAKGLFATIHEDFFIKWPNDILYNRKKVCGILCESKKVGEDIHYICGFGVNLSQSATCFQNQGLPYATSIKAETGKELPLEKVAAEIIKCLNECINAEFPEIIDFYRHYCITIGQQVSVQGVEEEQIGKALSIDETGNLIIQTQQTILKVNANEVSVRGLYGYL